MVGDNNTQHSTVTLVRGYEYVREERSSERVQYMEHLIVD
jgi:hypothetical protein